MTYFYPCLCTKYDVPRYVGKHIPTLLWQPSPLLLWPLCSWASSSTSLDTFRWGKTALRFLPRDIRPTGSPLWHSEELKWQRKLASHLLPKPSNSSVWPELASVCHVFGKILNVFGNFLNVYLFSIGQNFKPTLPNFYYFGAKIFIATNGQILDKWSSHLVTLPEVVSLWFLQFTLSRILLLTMGRTPLDAMQRNGPMSFRRTLYRSRWSPEYSVTEN